MPAAPSDLLAAIALIRAELPAVLEAAERGLRLVPLAGRCREFLREGDVSLGPLAEELAAAIDAALDNSRRAAR